MTQADQASPRCPKHDTPLQFICNERMDFKTEKLPICLECGIAYRDPKLGWKEIEEERKEENCGKN